jgi:hypothetical protein
LVVNSHLVEASRLRQEQTYRMRRISHDTGHALLPPSVGFVDPQAPWPDFVTKLEVSKDVAIEVWIWRKELFYASLRIPGLVVKVTRIPREEAVIRKKPTSVAGGKNNLVVSVVAPPIFYGAVLGVIDKSKFHCLLSVNVGMETSASSRLPVRFDAKDTADGRTDSVGADYHVMRSFFAVFKCYLTVHKVDIHRLHSCELSRAWICCPGDLITL